MVEIVNFTAPIMASLLPTPEASGPGELGQGSVEAAVEPGAAGWAAADRARCLASGRAASYVDPVMAHRAGEDVG